MSTTLQKTMVLSNTGIPDSGNSDNNELSPSGPAVDVDILIPNGHTETDSDDEDNPYNGYVPLPMNDFHNDASNSGEDSEGDDEHTVGTPVEEAFSLPPITRIENVLVKEVWSGPTPKEVDIEMDPNKVNEVKQAMLNITLPSTSIPEWASNIPEEEWKQQLINRLQDLQKN